MQERRQGEVYTFECYTFLMKYAVTFITYPTKSLSINSKNLSFSNNRIFLKILPRSYALSTQKHCSEKKNTQNLEKICFS